MKHLSHTSHITVPRATSATSGQHAGQHDMDSPTVEVPLDSSRQCTGNTRSWKTADGPHGDILTAARTRDSPREEALPSNNQPDNPTDGAA